MLLAPAPCVDEQRAGHGYARVGERLRKHGKGLGFDEHVGVEQRHQRGPVKLEPDVDRGCKAVVVDSNQLELRETPCQSRRQPGIRGRVDHGDRGLRPIAGQALEAGLQQRWSPVMDDHDAECGLGHDPSVARRVRFLTSAIRKVPFSSS